MSNLESVAQDRNGVVPAVQDADVELGRLAALHRLDVVNSNSEDLDAVTRLVATHFDMPTSYISLVGSERQWLKSHFGLEYEVIERDASFCTHTVACADLLVIEDTLLDPRFRDNPQVTGPAQIRFYAGAPLMTPDGYAIGALCLMDRKPRTLDGGQRTHLQELAAFVMSHILLRRTVGRIDPLSGMPNKYQLAEDLAALRKTASGQRRVLAYIDMPDTATSFEIATVLGIAVYDKLISNVSQKIRGLLDGAADVYHLADTRFGVLSRDSDTDAFSALLRGLDLATPVGKHECAAEPAEFRRHSAF